MEHLKIFQWIEWALKKATFEFDSETHSWCVWVPEIPGIFVQENTVEEARSTLIEVLEEYLLVSLENKENIPGFIPSRKRVSTKIKKLLPG